MKTPLLVDTDILIDFLRGLPQAVQFVEKYSDRFILSSIVTAELYAGVKGDHELDVLDRLLGLFRIIPVSKEIARCGGLYKMKYGKSHGTGLADAIIAATAEHESAELITLNTKHYPMFHDLSPAYTKT